MAMLVSWPLGNGSKVADFLPVLQLDSKGAFVRTLPAMQEKLCVLPALFEDEMRLSAGCEYD